MGPRIFCIPASESPVLAVVRRGPSSWSHLGRWDPDAATYQPGSWLRARIYPQRSDLSPDGRWFVHLVLKGGATWDVGSTYIAISRLPWLTALAAWSTCGTWTRGCQFVTDRSQWVGDPDVGDPRPLRQRYGLAGTRPETFAVERCRGWRESAATPARAPWDAWDERRADHVVMEKPNPLDPGLRLLVSGWFAAFRESSPGRGQAPLCHCLDGEPSGHQP